MAIDAVASSAIENMFIEVFVWNSTWTAINLDVDADSEELLALVNTVITLIPHYKVNKGNKFHKSFAIFCRFPMKSVYSCDL